MSWLLRAIILLSAVGGITGCDTSKKRAPITSGAKDKRNDNKPEETHTPPSKSPASSVMPPSDSSTRQTFTDDQEDEKVRLNLLTPTLTIFRVFDPKRENRSFPLDIQDVKATVNCKDKTLNFDVRYKHGDGEKSAVMTGALDDGGESLLKDTLPDGKNQILASSTCMTRKCDVLLIYFFAKRKGHIERVDVVRPADVFGECNPHAEVAQPPLTKEDLGGLELPKESIPSNIDQIIEQENGGSFEEQLPIISSEFFENMIDSDSVALNPPTEEESPPPDTSGGTRPPPPRPSTPAEPEPPEQEPVVVYHDPEKLKRESVNLLIPYELGPSYPGQAVRYWNGGALRGSSRLRDSGVGYRVQKPGVSYGSGFTLKYVEMLGAELAKQFSRTVLTVTQISRATGGATGGESGSHQNGLDIDILYMKKGVDFIPAKYTPKVQFSKGKLNTDLDLPRMCSALKILQKMGSVQYIFVSGNIRKALCTCFKKGSSEFNENRDILARLYVDPSDHSDHWHLRLQCTPHNRLGSTKCMGRTYKPNPANACSKT